MPTNNSDPLLLQNPLFQAVLDGSPVSLLVLDQGGYVVLANRAAGELLHWSTQEIVGIRGDRLIQPPDYHAESSRVTGVLQLSVDESPPIGTFCERKDLIAIRKDGARVPARVELARIQTPEGEWFAASIFDTRDRAALESELLAARSQLAAYWEAAPQGLITVDDQGVITTVNGAAERMLGYTSSELTGQAVEMLLPEDRRAAHAQHRAGYLADPKLRPMAADRNLQIRKKDGTRLEVEIGLNAVRMNDRMYAMALITDLTERRKLERAVLDATEKLVESMDERSNMLERLLDLQQELIVEGRTKSGRRPAGSLLDPQTGFGTRTLLMQALEDQTIVLSGLYVMVFTIRHLRLLTDKFGKTTADHLMVFVAQYLSNALRGEEDALYRWSEGSFVALARRSNLIQTRQELSELCGRRLEHLIERGGRGTALVLLGLKATTVRVEEGTPEDLAARIDRILEQEHGLRLAENPQRRPQRFQ